MMICNISANNWLCLATLLRHCCSQPRAVMEASQAKDDKWSRLNFTCRTNSRSSKIFIKRKGTSSETSSINNISNQCSVWLENILLSLNSCELPISKISKWVDGLKFHLWSPKTRVSYQQCDHQNIFPIKWYLFTLSYDGSSRGQEPDSCGERIIFANHHSPKPDCWSDKYKLFIEQDNFILEMLHDATT